MADPQSKDALDQAIVRLAAECERNTLSTLSEGVTAALAAIPFIGGSISDLLSSEARIRLVRRMRHLAEAMTQLINELDQAKIDKDFFKSEEFQTLLALAWGQLQTTHHEQKVKAIAAALVNGGTEEFRRDERKERFVRILQDLSVRHIAELKELLPDKRYERFPGNNHWPVEAEAHGDKLSLFQALASHGLVDEFLESDGTSGIGSRVSNIRTESDIIRAVEDVLKRVPKRCFRLSFFGRDFLRFVGQRPELNDDDISDRVPGHVPMG